MRLSNGSMRQGFSAIEVLVVVSLIGVMIGLILPAVQRARDSASQVGCRNNLRQIGLAIHQVHDAQGYFPPPFSHPNGRQSGGIGNLMWTVQLLPYIEQQDLWKRTLQTCTQDPISFHNPPHTGLTVVVRTYACPTDGRLRNAILDDVGQTAAYSSYLAVFPTAKQKGAMGTYLSPMKLADVTDGTSQTLMIGERPPPGRHLAGNWYTMYVDPVWTQDDYYRGPSLLMAWPTNLGRCQGPFYFGPGRIDNPCDSYHFWSLHSGGANFLFVDNHVMYLPYSAEKIMVALATPNGGETIDVPD